MLVQLHCPTTNVFLYFISLVNFIHFKYITIYHLNNLLNHLIVIELRKNSINCSDIMIEILTTHI